MLVHNFIYGRPGCSPQLLAEKIFFCLYPYKPEDQSDIDEKWEYAKLINDGSGGKEFFCYEHQFCIGFKEFDNRYEFHLKWHGGHHKDETSAHEKAIALLHSHVFSWSS